jgi:hypothetical protein
LLLRPDGKCAPGGEGRPIRQQTLIFASIYALELLSQSRSGVLTEVTLGMKNKRLPAAITAALG